MSDSTETRLAVHEAVCSERYKMISETEAKLFAHEQICTERYIKIVDQLSDGSKRMSKIEYLLYAVILAVLLGPGVAADFVKKLLGL